MLENVAQFTNCQTSHDSDRTGWASATGTGVYAAQMEELIIENQHVTFKIHLNNAWEAADSTVMRKWKVMCVSGCECVNQIFIAAVLILLPE